MKKLQYHFAQQMGFYRERARLSMKALAEKTSIDGRRLSAIEKKRRPANAKEAELIRGILGFGPASTELLGRAAPRDWKRPSGLFIPRADRHSSIRIREAGRKHGPLMSKLEHALAGREDKAELVDFLDELALDSSLEAVAVFRLLANGGRVGFESPARFGYWGRAIIEPRHQRPIVALRRPAIALGDLVLFPQVSFNVGWVVRVDFLVCLRNHVGSVDWFVVELDGEGHRVDHSRERLLHPVFRFSEREVLGDTFVPLLTCRLGRGLAA